jgi:predicted helicase
MTSAEYCKKIEAALKAGNATEHTHRPALKSFIESLDSGIIATNEPKRIKCGAPDFIVTRGEIPLGYIEAKDVSESLDNAEKSEQLARYRESLSNLVLTDYLEFRWFVLGEHRLTGRLATAGANGSLKAVKGGAEEVAELLTAFINAQIPTVGSAKELAGRMAAIARLIRNTISRAFTDEDRGGALHQQMEGFQKVLLHDLTQDRFADMYAQTISYGLFAARCNVRGSEHFTRQHAAYNLPKTNPFLRKMFGHIPGPDLDDRIVWAVDDLAELLHHTNISAILEDFGKRTRREDPVVHFYETFLAAYDPKMREARGVYYTPEPVVSYIVRSVDQILKTDFNLPDGLADASKIKVKSGNKKSETDVHKVLILDPATGTGTFLYDVIKTIFDSFKNNLGMWSGYVSEHLLPRLFGFELLMAPYSVAHMKLGLVLEDTGYDFATDERLRVYLTNTLEEAHADSKLPLFAQWLAEEANSASHIKQEVPVMVVLGNPPYSGHSANTGQWIADLLRGRDTLTGKPTANYFEVDGNALGERNPKYLNDDYVKFIRFAQWRIELTGYGVLAFITNHGYLDNPTFRGMRQSLMRTFDDIHVLDLHGNSNKKERAPDGSKDENVFDIQQGVAIGIFVKQKRDKNETASVRHVDLWGVREVYEQAADGEKILSGGKYHWLQQHEMSTTKWTVLTPQRPFYFFMPQDKALESEYEQGYKITDLMPISSTGVKTHRDHFVVRFSLTELEDRVEDFRDTGISDGEIIDRYNLQETNDWRLSEKRRALAKDGRWRSRFTILLYRPFDFRFYFHHEALVDRPRQEVMRHMLAGDNVGLVTSRQTKEQWDAHASKYAIDHKSLAAYDTNSLFPLYLYQTNKQSLFDDHEPGSTSGSRTTNLAPEVMADFAARLQLIWVQDGKGDLTRTFGPEDVFNYLYAMFHSPTYRNRYTEFLKIDFPRLPLTSNPDLFRALCHLGKELVALHLMEKHRPKITSYPIAGANSVEIVRYTEPSQGANQGRVWINRHQYFEGVPPELWSFNVGGYQVCQKWLKDRKGRKLTYDDLTHYQHVVSALAETIRIMAEIDDVIEDNGGWPIGT